MAFSPFALNLVPIDQELVDVHAARSLAGGQLSRARVFGVVASLALHVGFGLLIARVASVTLPIDQTEPSPDLIVELAFAENTAAPAAEDTPSAPEAPTSPQEAQSEPEPASPPDSPTVPIPKPRSQMMPAQAPAEQLPDPMPASDLPPVPVPVPPQPPPPVSPPAKAQRPATAKPLQRRDTPTQPSSPASETAPTGTSAVLAARPPSRDSVAASTPDWRAAFLAWLHGRKSYPEQARRQSIQGRVVVRFTVSRDGEVSDIFLVAGSGSALLDEAALAMLKGARSPSFPANMTGDRIMITVPISYSLKR
jgi:protein TonB